MLKLKEGKRNMSIDTIRSVFVRLADYDAWTLQLLRIKTSKRDGTRYTGREISFSPEGRLNVFISEIIERYTDSEKGILNKYVGI